jgi:hypothetical protein
VLSIALAAACALAYPAAPAGAEERGPGGAADPSIVGQWELRPEIAPRTPIHGALLRTGEVWLGSGSGSAYATEDGPYVSFLWDPADGGIEEIEAPWDLFCAGHAFLPNGRLLVAGGTIDYPTTPSAYDWKGSAQAYVFDPVSRQYRAAPDMAGGRWYPTLLPLADGGVYTFAGLDASGLRMNRVPEIYRPGLARWVTRPTTPAWPMYPALFLARGGDLLFTGGHANGDLAHLHTGPGMLDPDTSTFQPYPGLTEIARRDQSSSVLLPPAQAQRFMIIGGGSASVAAAHAKVDIVTLGAASPRFEAAPRMRKRRIHHSAVLLPDRTVLVVGGGRRREAEPVMRGEIYDPRARTWTLTAPAAVPRLYHSLALLLPDGRVLVAGSNPPGTWERRMEVYSPPYLFKGPRPVIEDAPQELPYGGTFRIHTPQARGIRWVSLIRPSTATHALNPEQRVIKVPIREVGDGTLDVRVTADRSIAPPGWYMLFVTDHAGVPSVARWVHLAP